jgi:hypothetical protein
MRRRITFAVIAVLMLLPLGCVMHKTSKASFCKELRRTPSLTEVFGALTTDSPSTLRSKARRTAEQFIRLQRAAPRDIRASVSEVADLASKVAKAVEDAPNNPQAVANALRREVSDSLGPARAALKLADYSTKNCHYDLNRPTGPSLTTPSSTNPASPTSQSPFQPTTTG